MLRIAMNARVALSRRKAPELLDERAITPKELKLLAEPSREFIYQALVAEARTASELATLMDCPTTRLYHHLKLLENAGLILVVAERLVSGIVERRYRAVARRLRLDRRVFGVADPEQQQLASILDYVFDRARDEIERSATAGRIDLGQQPPAPSALLCYRHVLKLTPAQRDRLQQQLRELYAEYEQLSADPAPEGEFYGMVVAAYPTELRAADEPKPRGAQGKRGPRVVRR